jgi:F0F1-type ATP synthase assembly protein I
MSSKQSNGSSRTSSGREFYKYGGLGFEFVVIVGIFAFLGDWADRRWQCDPWGLLVGCGVGLTTGLYFLVKESNKMMRSMDSKSNPDDMKPSINKSDDSKADRADKRDGL